MQGNFARKEAVSRWLARIFMLQIVFLVTWVVFAGVYLSSPNEAPKASDLVVILGGGTGERLEKGASLLEQGLAQQVMVTGFRMEDAVLQQWQGSWRKAYLMDKGVPAEAILLKPDVASTYDEVQAVLSLMRERDYQRVLIVSDPPHLRRIHSVFSEVFAGQPYEYATIAADANWWHPWRWWTNPGAIGFVLTETVKMVFYWIRY